MNISPSFNSGLDFLLITALEEERDAVLSKLTAYHKLPPTEDDTRTYFQANLPVIFPDGSTGKYYVAVMCLSGMGRVQAATATTEAIRRWNPRYIMLIGIAGGIAARRVQIGDILISDQIVDYELQKLTSNEPEIRWDVHRADARLSNACNNYRDESWRELIKVKRPRQGRPNRHVGPIASGDKIIAIGEILTKYRNVWPKLLGVEMEAAGVATAAFQSSHKPGFFMVRGVSDLADENKGSSHVEKWRSYACHVAASFAIAFLRSGPVPLLHETKQVQVIFEGEFGEFNAVRQEQFISVIAILLGIKPSDIRVLKVQQGSIVMLMELPNAATDKFYELVVAQNSSIKALGITSIAVEDGRHVEFAYEGIKIPNSQPEPQSYHEYRPERFVNRPKILDEIRSWANASDIDRRVLSIAAAPGSGKTWILNAFYDEWKSANPFAIRMNLPELVSQQENRKPDQILNIDSLIHWVQGIWQDAQVHCAPVAPLDATRDISAILDKLVQILCDCNLQLPPLVIVDGYDEIAEKQARRVVERRLLEYLIERDCMRMLIAYREQDEYALQSDTLRKNQRLILLDTVDPLSPEFAKKQFALLAKEGDSHANGLPIDTWMSNLKNYQWNHPLANAFLFNRTLSSDQSQLMPLSPTDLETCCFDIITRPFEGQEPKYELTEAEFAWLMRIAIKLEDEWTEDSLRQICNLTIKEIDPLFVNGLIIETSPPSLRRKIPDPIRMLLRDLHLMQEGINP